MDIRAEQHVSIGFFSFVGSNYSRSSTLLNFKSEVIDKTYIHVPGKFPKSVKWLFEHRRDFEKFDALVVMSPCHMLTPVLKMFIKKPIILDAGWSLTDGVLSRGFKFQNLYKLPITYAIDLISMHSANLLLVESALQISRVKKCFALPLRKLKCSYTGLDESQFGKSTDYQEAENQLISDLKKKIDMSAMNLVVLFRGKVNRESGFENICESARILAKEATFIFILGEKDLIPNDLENVIKLSKVSPIEMKEIYEMAHLTVGQISNHPRLRYTIPHKAFEAGYFKKAYVTAKSEGIKEIFNEGSVMYLHQASPESLAAAILELSNQKNREKLEEEIGFQYQNTLSQEVINNQFAQLIREISNQPS